MVEFYYQLYFSASFYCDFFSLVQASSPSHDNPVYIWQTNCNSHMWALSVSFSQFEAVTAGAGDCRKDQLMLGSKDCKRWKFLSGIQLNLNGHDSVYHLHIERMLITQGFEAGPGHSEAFCRAHIVLRPIEWQERERGVNAPPRLWDGLQWPTIDN